MGRASRKKNRLRGQAGGLYSQLWKEKALIDMYKGFKTGDLYNSIENKYIETEAEFWNQIMHNMFSQQFKIDPTETLNPTIQYELCIQNLKNRSQHYYIASKNVLDFLENNKIANEDIPKAIEIIKSNVKSIPVSEYAIDMNSNRVEHNGIIHFLDRKYSLIFRCSSLFVDYEEKHYIAYGIGLSEDEQWVASIFEDETLDSATKSPYWKILLNTFLYIDAFPEAVRQGPPPVKIYNGPVSVHNTIVGESTAIKDTYRNGVTPHMRRGHFRFLQSDKFKKKRYQTIYIKPTMIKGHAEHIVEGIIND